MKVLCFGSLNIDMVYTLPHIVNVGRVWCCGAMAGVPLVGLLLGSISPALWEAAQLVVILTLTLGGLFIPMYVVGKKYQ